MGWFRFLLACMVVISHMGIELRGTNPGVVSVVVFYLLAGQVVSRLWLRQDHLPIGQRTRWFIRDRCWRILPMYYAMLTAAILIWALGADSYFLSNPNQPGAWLNNLTILPLNYYMVTGADTFTLLPPAWSLAAELQFYLLVPLLLSYRPLFWLSMLTTLAVFAMAQIGWLDTDVFGYRLLAGVGFVFLCGSLLGTREAHPGRRSTRMLLALWVMMAAYTLWLALHPDNRVPFNFEVALGFTLGLPAVILLSRWRPTGVWHRGQRMAGVLSYGVFLVHFPVIWLLELYCPTLAINVAAVIALSTVLALSGHLLVETPLWQLYRKLLKDV